MKCEKCHKNEATVFYRENINGKETKMHLCAACAGEKEKESAFPFGELSLDGLFGNVFSNLGAPEAFTSEKKRCTLCGCTYSDVEKMGKVGCYKCYESFAEEMANTLRRLHGTATHKGKFPEGAKEKLSVLRRIEMLEAELKAAVANEEYEEAARLRDEIRNMRDGGGEK